MSRKPDLDRVIANPMESRCLPMLCCDQRGSIAKAILMHAAVVTSNETLVARARAEHLPSAPPARPAHPHTT